MMRLCLRLSIATLVCASLTNCLHADDELLITYLDSPGSYKNLTDFLVVEFNTETGQMRELEEFEPYWNKMVSKGCGQQYYTPVDDPFYKTIIDIRKLPEIFELVEQLKPMQETFNRRQPGPVAASSTNLRREFYSKSGYSDIDGVFMYRKTCHRGKKLISLIANVRKPVKPYQNVVLHLIYDKGKDTVILVDSLWHHYRDVKRESLQMGHFDQKGESFYYTKDNFALRFNISSHVIDTIHSGNVPVAPWNSDQLLVYSNEKKQLYLLDSLWRVVNKIEAGEWKELLSAYAVTDDIYLIGTRDYGKYTGNILMKVDMYDFSTGIHRELFSEPGFQIIDAEFIK